MTGGEDLFGLVGYQLEGKYAVDMAVARGGFGVVYRARHIALLTQHAVKVLRVPPGLPAELHQRFLTQFVEEARIIAQFQHPAVVRVTDFGVSIMPTGEHAPWMVLEWIEGMTLADHLNARRGQGGRSPRECLDLLYPVLDALAAAHEMGIAHRDIKPGNIMLASDALAASMRGSRRGGGARPATRVLDFGIAKLMSEGDDGPASGQTRTHSLIPAYSPKYASPEQASGTRTGPWTDVHALALILTEMLTDCAPYDGTDKLRLNMLIMSPNRPTPARFGVDVGAWEPVLAKALAFPPADRFPNAGEFLAALEANVPTLSQRVVSSTVPVSTPPYAPPQSSPPPGPVVGESSTLRPATAPQAPPTPARTRMAVIAMGLLACASVAGVTVVRLTRTNDLAPAPARPTAMGAQMLPQPPPAPATPQTAPAAPPAAPPQVVAPVRPAPAPIAAPANVAQPAIGRARPGRAGRHHRAGAPMNALTAPPGLPPEPSSTSQPSRPAPAQASASEHPAPAPTNILE